MAFTSDEELAIRIQMNDRGIFNETQIQNEISRRSGRLNETQVDAIKEFIHSATLNVNRQLINATENDRIAREYNACIQERTTGRTMPTQEDFMRIIFGDGTLPSELLSGLVDVPKVLADKTFKDIEEGIYNDIKKRLTEKELDNIETECSICLCDFEDDEKVKRLKCGHMFHIDCVKEWLTKHNYTCSVCNSEAGEHITKT